MTDLLSTSPVGRWPIYQLETGQPFDMAAWYNWVGGVGAACWLVAYIITIIGCFKQRTYGIPLVAICLNFTWELMDSFVLPDPIPLWIWIDRAWFIVDVLIVFQLVRYGRAEQVIEEIRKSFHWIITAMLAFAFYGQYAWVTTMHDTLGLILAFVINFIMSALFISFYFARRDTGRGLSLRVAWLKMFGTALSSMQCYFLLPIVHPVDVSTTLLPTYSLFHFLFVGCFVLDCIYIWLLSRGPRHESHSAQTVDALTSA